MSIEEFILERYPQHYRLPINLSAEAEKLGYHLSANERDTMGRLWKYRTTPISGSGVVNYFENTREVMEWISQVKKIRVWQNDQN